MLIFLTKQILFFNLNTGIAVPKNYLHEIWHRNIAKDLAALTCVKRANGVKIKCLCEENSEIFWKIIIIKINVMIDMLLIFYFLHEHNEKRLFGRFKF